LAPSATCLGCGRLSIGVEQTGRTDWADNKNSTRSYGGMW